jgi:hypothetical protein
MDEYIKREDAIKHLIEECIVKYPISFGFGLQAAVKELRKIPAAYVAPKSEVDKWVLRCQEWHSVAELKSQQIVKLEQENEALKDSNEHLAVLLAEAKTEVAREIFEEIENAKYTILGLHDVVSMGDIEELEKKYTEQCPDCKHFVGCECFDGKTCDEYEEGEK